MPRRRPPPPAPVQPVAGPGKLATRTDRTPQGAAASRGEGQPIRAATGGPYGARQATIQQQQAAPLFAGDIDPRIADAINAPVGENPGAFVPTLRPNEPITAGAAVGPGPGPGATNAGDPDLLLQAMAAVLPHPAIMRLLMSDGNL